MRMTADLRQRHLEIVNNCDATTSKLCRKTLLTKRGLLLYVNLYINKKYTGLTSLDQVCVNKNKM